MDATPKNQPLLLELAADWSARRLRENKVPLTASFLIGLLCYMYAFTNKLLNHDEAHSLFMKGGTVTSGRWGLGALDTIFPNYSMPWIYGIMAIFFMSLAICLMIRILKLKGSVLQVLFAGTVMAFPSLIGTFSYMFTSNSFALAFLLAVIAVWFAGKDRLILYIPALGFMVASLSIYQSYISVAAGLLVLILIRQLLEDEDIQTVIFRGIRFVVFLGASLGIYYGATQVILILKDVTFNEYAGGNMGFSIAGIPTAVVTAYRNFFRFFTEGFQGLMPTVFSRLLHSLCLLCTLVLLVLRCRGKKPGCIAMILALTAVLPLAMNCMYLFTTEDAVHTLVLYGVVAVYGLCALVCDVTMAASKASSFARQVLLNLVSLALACIVVCNIYLANETWLNLHLRYENAYGFYSGLMAQLQTMPEFQEGCTVALIGNYQDPEFYETEFDFTDKITVVKGFKPDSYSRERFLLYYLGISLPFASQEECQNLAQKPEVVQMPCYPYYGSTKIIENTVVVKLS